MDNGRRKAVRVLGIAIGAAAAGLTARTVNAQQTCNWLGGSSSVQGQPGSRQTTYLECNTNSPYPGGYPYPGGGGSPYPETEANTPDQLAATSHVTMNLCSADPKITAVTANLTSRSMDEERHPAAYQVLAATFANHINRKKDGFLATIRWTDGGTEQYRHTSFAGWRAVAGTLTLGTGIPGSACSTA